MLGLTSTSLDPVAPQSVDHKQESLLTLVIQLSSINTAFTHQWTEGLYESKFCIFSKVLKCLLAKNIYIIVSGIRGSYICEEMENMWKQQEKKNRQPSPSERCRHLPLLCFYFHVLSDYFPSLFTRGKGFTPYLVFSQCSTGNNESTRHSRGDELLWPSWIKLQRASLLQAAMPLMRGANSPKLLFLWRASLKWLISSISNPKKNAQICT